MRGVKKILYRFPVAAELLAFFWGRKHWWLTPFVFIMILFGILFVVGEVTGLGPFVYAIF